MRIDINCDMGESADPSHDRALMPFVTSCNVACGGHAGDVSTMEMTIREAVAHGVAVGAHPAYPDRDGFGRRAIDIAPTTLRECLISQLSTVRSIAERLGADLAHVKPHGALYNVAANCEATSRCILDAVQSACPEARLVGLAGSVTERVSREAGFRFLSEAFADRSYTDAGHLVPRTESNAVITDPDAAAAQVISIVQQKRLHVGDTEVSVQASTICVHGDNPAAMQILLAIDTALAEHGIIKACP